MDTQSTTQAHINERIFNLVRQTCADLALQLPKVQELSAEHNKAVHAADGKVDKETYDFIEDGIWVMASQIGDAMFKMGFELGQNPASALNLPDSDNFFSA
jgi:hypothetical protein